MTNIFETVEAYYQHNEAAAPILSQATVERYLRRLLWRGATQAELARVFDLICTAIDRAENMGLAGLEEFESIDMQETVDVALLDREDNDPVTPERVRDLLHDLQAFLTYLAPDQKQQIADDTASAEQAYFVDGTFVDPTELDDDDLAYLDELAGDDPFLELAPEDVDGIVNELLEAIRAFFRAPVYHADLQRAMMLFFGPVRMQEAPGDETALAHDLEGFWDYFLFDYDRIADDRLPLRAFVDAKRPDIHAGRRAVLRDLLQSTFTVFYVERLEGDSAFCRDIFTNEEMELPRPEAHGHDPRKTLLYGHVHADGVMLLNYIIIVPATAALRRRIHEQIERLYAIYQMQAPQASIASFFRRHAVAVRHLIDLMTSYAQLTIVPELPQPPAIADEPLPRSLAAFAQTLDTYAIGLGFAAFERTILARLYRAAVTVVHRQGAEKNAFLAAVMLYFAIQNAKDIGDIDAFFELFHTTKAAVVTELTRLFAAFGMMHPDPRFLTEIGFVHLLFRAPEPRPTEQGTQKGEGAH